MRPSKKTDTKKLKKAKRIKGILAITQQGEKEDLDKKRKEKSNQEQSENTKYHKNVDVGKAAF